MQDRPRVGEILVAAGIIDEIQLKAALGEQSRWGRRLGVTLIKMGMVEEGHLIRALAKQLDLPVASLAGKRIPADVIALVPARVASEHGVMPLFVKGDGPNGQLYLGMEDPSNLAVLDDLSFRTGMEIHPVMIGPTELGEAIDRYYHNRGGGAPQTDPFRGGDTMDPRSLRVVTDDSAQPGTAPAENAPSIETEVAASPAPTAIQKPATSPTPIELTEPATTAAPPARDQSTAPAAATAPPEPATTAAVTGSNDTATPPAPTSATPQTDMPVATASGSAEAFVQAPPPVAAPVAQLPEGLLDDVTRAIDETERTRIVAKAIAQLLVEKGLVRLEELQGAIADLKAASESEPPSETKGD